MSPPDLTIPIDKIPPPPQAKVVVTSRGRTHRRLRAWLDRLAAVIVWTGGIATIVSIMGIFIYLLIEVAPLFLNSEPENPEHFPVQGMKELDPSAFAIGVDQYQEVAYLIYEDQITFYSVPDGTSISYESSGEPLDDHVAAVARSQGRGHDFAFGTNDGQIIPIKIELTPTFQNDVRTIVPSLRFGDPIVVDPSKSSINRLAYQRMEEGHAVVTLNQAGEIWLTKSEESEGLMLSDEPVMTQTLITTYSSEKVTSLILDSLGETLLFGTNDGRLFHWNIQNPSEPELIKTYALSDTNDFITALTFLIGDRSLAVGTNRGSVSVWMPVPIPGAESLPRYQQVRSFESHAGPVTSLSPSRRDKGFLSTDSQGNIFLHHSTSSQTLLHVQVGNSPIIGSMFAPKADGAVAFDATGYLHSVGLNNAHPEITARTLFRPVLYEGYADPEHIWQSSSGSDDFEPKFGMWPLIFGTLKGTIYAMLLAVPLAVMGAIYTGMFMSPQLRGVVKPVVETMAALPSVVLGFLAGLWLAPLLEDIFPAVIAMVVLMPMAVAFVCLLWQLVPRSIRSRGQSGLDLSVITLVLLATAVGCLAANQGIESWVFGADYKAWLLSVFDVQYDQRNALVISLAMGFAVIPIIFSISEDSISNVPKHLIAGSLAMGATQWQTLTRLVLVSASPGIFSALMIGFGRAVGETMIVLMATGNTPILDWSVFNGFRTLSANIAVEMPEAPHGGTLYRVLFLSGLLLFAFTFVINTVAEVIRQRLRMKYSQY